MKKLIKLSIIALLIMLNVAVVRAGSFTTALSSTKTSVSSVGEQFTLTFAVRNSTGLSAITASLHYDALKLEIVSSSAESGFALTVGNNKFVVDHTELKTGNFNIAKITFKTKADFQYGQSTSILWNPIGSDGNEDFSGTGSGVTIKMTQPKSDNSYLSSLSINQGSLNFDKTKTSYTVIVDHATTSVVLSASAEDGRSSISGTGTKKLEVYSNVYNIVVTAENGSKRTYSINVVRRDADGNAGALSTNNNLSEINIQGCPLSFSVNELEYRCEVDNLTLKVDVSAKTEDENATFLISNIAELSIGDNSITISVTSESGAIKVYTVVINRSKLAANVDIASVKDVLLSSSIEEVAIKVPEDGIVSDDILQTVKQSKKKLLVRGYDEHGSLLYEWIIDGKQASSLNSIYAKLMVMTDLEKSLDELTNYAKGIYLDFDKNEVLPEGTQIRIKASSMFADGEKVKLYYYDASASKLQLQGDQYEVIEGYITINLTHTSEYFLTQSTIGQNRSSFNLWLIVAMVELLLIAGLGLIFIKSKHSKPKIEN
jgi:hypothetical protein